MRCSDFLKVVPIAIDKLEIFVQYRREVDLGGEKEIK